MLTQEIIQSNFKKYLDLLESNQIQVSNLVNKLGVELISAPYTTTNKFYGAFEGGFIDQSLRIGKYMYQSNKMLPEGMRVSQRSIMLVSLLHAVASVISFKPNPSQWHVEKLGQIYVFNEDLVSMTFGERSVKMIIDAGIELTDEEYQAILNYNKEDDKQAKSFSSTLAQLLKVAIILANEEGKKIINE